MVYMIGSGCGTFMFIDDIFIWDLELEEKSNLRNK